eukprot:EG_transcript_32038
MIFLNIVRHSEPLVLWPIDRRCKDLVENSLLLPRWMQAVPRSLFIKLYQIGLWEYHLTGIPCHMPSSKVLEDFCIQFSPLPVRASGPPCAPCPLSECHIFWSSQTVAARIL